MYCVTVTKLMLYIQNYPLGFPPVMRVPLGSHLTITLYVANPY